MNPLVGEIIDVIGRLQNMVGGSLDPRGLGFRWS
jgi:hypothetical protein